MQKSGVVRNVRKTSGLEDRFRGVGTLLIWSVLLFCSVGAREASAFTLSATAPNTQGYLIRTPLLADYPSGTTVTLYAGTRQGYRFTGWTGDVPAGQATANPLILTMDAVKTLTATFGAAQSGAVRVWGNYTYGQDTVPSPNTGYVAVAGGYEHSLGLKSDGSLVAWGNTMAGKCTVPTPNSGFVAVSAGVEHSVALKSNGSVVAWGYNGDGQCTLPASNTGFISVVAGDQHNLALKSDGSVVSWGSIKSLPSPNSGFVAIAANSCNMGLKADGSIVVWGGIDVQRTVPAPNSGFIGMATGDGYCLGLKMDGSVVAWGENIYNTCNVPLPNSGFVAVAAGGHDCLALRANDSVVTWGDSSVYPAPAPNTGYIMLAVGDSPDGTQDNLLAVEKEGIVQVTIEPSEAVAAGAQWRLTDEMEGVWHDSGTTTSIQAGTRVVEYKPVAGRQEPSAKTLSVAKNQVTSISATYQSIPTCTLSVNVPRGAYLMQWPVRPDYPVGSTVKLYVGARQGYQFAGWTGDVPTGQETADPLTITMNTTKTLTATYARTKGAVQAWGDANKVIDIVNNIPDPNTDFVAVAGSYQYTLALKSNGTIVSLTETPFPDTSNDFVAFSTQGNYCLALKSNGSIVAVGNNDRGQCNVPSPNTGFVAVAAGPSHSVGLKSDGSVVAWGENGRGECNVPNPNTGFVAVAAMNWYSMGLKSDGTIVMWGGEGLSEWDLVTIPSPNNDFVAVTGGSVGMGLKSDGSLIGWGMMDVTGQCNIPTPNSEFVSMSIGDCHTLGLKSNGSIVEWGETFSGAGQYVEIPLPNAGYEAIAAGSNYSLAIKSHYPIQVQAEHGSVSKSPDQALYLYGAAVTLTATPEVGYHFTGWSGTVSSTANPLALTVDSTLTLTANFEINRYALTVPTPAHAVLTKSPELTTYPHGTPVTLTVRPERYYKFVRWTGDVPGGMEQVNPLGLTMDSTRTLGVEIVEDTTPPTAAIVPVDAGPTSATEVAFQVAFSEDVFGFPQQARLAIAHTGDTTYTTTTLLRKTARDYEVQLFGVGGNGLLTLEINPSSCVDIAGNINEHLGPGAPIVVDNTAPTTPTLDLAAADDLGTSSTDHLTCKTTVRLTGLAENAATVRILEKGRIVAEGTTSTFASPGIGVPVIAGDHSLTAVARDAAGNLSPASQPLSVRIDTQKPSVKNLALLTATPTRATSVTYTLEFTEPVFGFSSPDDVQVQAQGTTFSQIAIQQQSATLYQVTLGGVSGDGTIGISVKAGAAQDEAGNLCPIGNLSPLCVLDNTAPQVSLSIANGAVYVNQTTVTLSLAATDPGARAAGVFQMRFSNDALNWTAWEPVATSRAWGLPQTNGTTTVYAEVSDKVGNVGTVNDSIFLDTVAPATLAAPVGDEAVSLDTTVWFSWFAGTDPTPASGIARYQCQIGTTPGGADLFDGDLGLATKKMLVCPLGKTVYCRVRAFDQAGNAGAWSASSTGVFVNTPPVIASVGITPTEPKKLDVIRPVVQTTDADGDSMAAYRYEWLLNGVRLSTATELTSASIAKNQTWTLRAWAQDAHGAWSTMKTTQFSIFNSPPTQPLVQVIPQPARADEDLVVDILVYSQDPDGDPIKYDFKWYKSTDGGNTWTHKVELDGSPQVSQNYISEGELWDVFYTPYEAGAAQGTLRALPETYTASSRPASVPVARAAARAEEKVLTAWDRSYVGENAPPQFRFDTIQTRWTPDGLQLDTAWTATDGDGEETRVNLSWTDLEYSDLVTVGQALPGAPGRQSALVHPTPGKPFYLHAAVSDTKGAVTQVITRRINTSGLQVTNPPASELSQTSARLNGALSGTGNQRPEVFVYWGQADGGMEPSAWKHVEKLGVQGDGAFSVKISGLQSKTRYLYRIVARSAQGEAWSASTQALDTNEFSNTLQIQAENGTVTVSPLQPSYAEGTAVTLRPVPAAGYRFVRWEGDVPAGSETTPTVTLTMTGSRTVRAVFERMPPMPMWLISQAEGKEGMKKSVSSRPRNG